MKQRYIEIDLLRTLAIVMMVIYHTAFDLWYFWKWDFDLFSPGWERLRIATFGLFLLLVGVSFVIAAERKTSRSAIWHRAVRRSAVVLGCAMLITIVTYIMDPDVFIHFGILHMIGVSILLMPLFRTFKESNILLGSLVLHLERAVAPPSFTSLDYYPLIPWFGIVLIGMALGHFFYIRFPQWRTSLQIPDSGLSALTLPGRHALLIYMVHQPILLFLLYLAQIA